MKPNITILASVFLIFLCWGCASPPDIVTTDKENNSGYSNSEIREITVDQPFLLSGDYFRERKQPPAVDLGRVFSSEKNITANQEQLEKKIDDLQKQVASLNKEKQKAMTSLPEKEFQDNKHKYDAAYNDDAVVYNAAAEQEINKTLKIKTGLLIDNTRVLPANIQKISITAEELVKKMPAILVNNDEIYETLAQNNALEKKDLYRTSGILTVYPGIRMLILIENFTLPDFFPGTGNAVISIVDSGLFYRYQPVRFEMNIQNNDDVQKFIKETIHTSLSKAIEASKVAPWFCRAFSGEGGLFYINAGEKTGLEKGALLKITSAGQVIKSPAGVPAGWIPGHIKGRLKIEQFFGKDFAACSIVEGEKPTVYDFLVLD